MKTKITKFNFKSWLENEKLKLKTIDQIPQWFLTNQKILMDEFNSICIGHGVFFDKFFENDTFTKFDLRPIRLNFDFDNTYWRCYIKSSLNRDVRFQYKNYPTSGILRMIGIKTFSGGGSNIDIGYSCEIHLKDWPGFKEEVEIIGQERVLNKICNRY